MPEGTDSLLSEYCLLHCLLQHATAQTPLRYGRGESGSIGTPEVRGRGESGSIGTPLARSLTAGRGESGSIGTPEVFGRGESGNIGTPLANAIAAFVAATATTVMTNERNRRAFLDMSPPCVITFVLKTPL